MCLSACKSRPLRIVALVACIFSRFVALGRLALILTLFHRQYLYNGWPRIFVKTTRTIGPGEEVLADYGDSYWTHFAGIALEHEQVGRCIRLALIHRCLFHPLGSL